MLALPEGPIVGLPCSGVRAPETNAERRIKGEALPVNVCSSSIDLFICRGVRILQEPDQHRLPQSSPRGGGPGDQHHTQCPGPGAPDQPQPPRPVQAPGHGGQRHRDRGHCGPGGRGGGGRQARPEVIWRSAPRAQLLPRDAEADAPPHVQTLPPLPPHTQPASLLQQPLRSEIKRGHGGGQEEYSSLTCLTYLIFLLCFMCLLLKLIIDKCKTIFIFV